MALGDDLPAAWSHPSATAETRKKILRAVLEEIVVTLEEDRIDLLLHWARRPDAPVRTAQPRWPASLDDAGGSFRNSQSIAVHRPGEMAARGELTLREAAARLSVSTMTVLRLIGAGAVDASQVCKGDPLGLSRRPRLTALMGRL